MNGLMTLIKSLAAKHKSQSNSLMHVRYGEHNSHRAKRRFAKAGKAKYWELTFYVPHEAKDFTTFSAWLLSVSSLHELPLFLLMLFFTLRINSLQALSRFLLPGFDNQNVLVKYLALRRSVPGFPLLLELHET